MEFFSFFSSLLTMLRSVTAASTIATSATCAAAQRPEFIVDDTGAAGVIATAVLSTTNTSEANHQVLSQHLVEAVRIAPILAPQIPCYTARVQNGAAGFIATSFGSPWP